MKLINKRAIKFLLLISLLVLPSYSNPDTLQSNQIKAAYIIRFIGLVQVSDYKGYKQPILRACLLADDSFVKVFKHIAALYKKELIVKPLYEAEQLAISNCHCVYIQDGFSENTPSFLFKLGILTISDKRDFSKKGGVIELVKKQSRIKYIVNLRDAKKTGLQLDSRLIGSAIQVM